MKQSWAAAKKPPENKPDRTRFILTLAFNAVPLAGVAFWGWSAFELILLYWLENVVIGVRTLIAIVLSGRFHGKTGAIATGVFFTIHYGIFCLVHGVFVFFLFGGALGSNSVAPMGLAVPIGLLAIVAWQGALLAIHITRGDDSTPMDLMNSPYPRIIALHVTILFGGYLLMSLDWPHAGIVVLAIVKTLMDAAIVSRGDRTDAAADRTATSVTPPPSRRRP